MKKLPDKLLLALARHYHARNAKARHQAKVALRDIEIYIKHTATFSTSDVEPEFDKEKSFNSIDKIAAGYGFSCCECAGTFWFSRKTVKSGSTICFQVNESDYLDSGTRTIDRKKKP